MAFAVLEFRRTPAINTHPDQKAILAHSKSLVLAIMGETTHQNFIELAHAESIHIRKEAQKILHFGSIFKLLNGEHVSNRGLIGTVPSELSRFCVTLVEPKFHESVFTLTIVSGFSDAAHHLVLLNSH